VEHFVAARHPVHPYPSPVTISILLRRLGPGYSGKQQHGVRGIGSTMPIAWLALIRCCAARRLLLCVISSPLISVASSRPSRRCIARSRLGRGGHRDDGRHRVRRSPSRSSSASCRGEQFVSGTRVQSDGNGGGLPLASSPSQSMQMPLVNLDLV